MNIFKNKVVVLFYILVFSINCNAQNSEYIHGLYGGGQYSFDTDQNFDAFMVGYYSRFLLSEVGDESSVGIASYLNGGYNESSGDLNQNFSNTNTYFISLPLVLEYNTGILATRDSYSRYGFFAGAGVDYTYFINKTTYENQAGDLVDSTHNNGVLSADLSAGFRFRIGIPLSFRFSTKIGFNGQTYYTVSGIIPFHNVESF